MASFLARRASPFGSGRPGDAALASSRHGTRELHRGIRNALTKGVFNEAVVTQLAAQAGAGEAGAARRTSGPGGPVSPRADERRTPAGLLLRHLRQQYHRVAQHGKGPQEVYSGPHSVVAMVRAGNGG